MMTAQTPQTGPPERLGRGRQLLFTLAMLLIPVVFFAMVEGVLRLVGYGAEYPLFVSVEEVPGYRYQNREVARRYFANQQEVPGSLIDFFQAEKQPDAFRIFVQGGSSAAGYPFYYGGSFSRMLGQRLQQTFPERRIEVVNTAMAAVNSFTLLDLADEILAEEPDAVLIYAGHNEYYGALGVGSSETVSAFPAVTRMYLELLDLRTVQLLRSLLSRGAALLGGREAGEAPSTTLMERMVGEQTIPYGSELYERGIEQWRSNLSRLLATYREAGVPVFIATVASNERDHRPFVGVLPDAADPAVYTARLREARAAAAEGAYELALRIVDDLLRRDTLSADAYYVRGQLLEALGRHEEARAAYLAAKDRDALRFRAPEAINAVIREEAARHGAVVVDVRQALASTEPNGIIGRRLMLEHLHPTIEGYFGISDAFYEALRRHGMIGEWSQVVPREQARSELLVTPVDSLVGVYRVRQLMASWPFQPAGVVDTTLLRVEVQTPVEEIARDLYLEKVGWRAANEALRQHLEDTGDYHGALQATLAHIQSYPLLARPYVMAGNILIRQHRYPEALAYFQAADDRESTSVTQRMIGSILLQQGRRDEALAHLERAVEMDGEDVQALFNLALAHFQGGAHGEARSVLTRLLALQPDHADARRMLAVLPKMPSGP